MTVSTLPAATPPSRIATGHVRAIGALWRRILAFVLDLLLVGFLQSIIAFFFAETFIRIGDWSLLVGVTLALPYYACFNSTLGNGQTIGKRILSLEVVDARGKPVSFEMSLVRYTVFVIPIVLSGVGLPVQMPRLFSVCISLAIGALTLATFYLICFNRKTRQGVHDLVAGTFVVEAGNPGPINPRPSWKPHWAILCSLIALFWIGGAIIQTNEVYAQLRQDADLIKNQQDVQSASVSKMWPAHLASPSNLTGYIAKVRWTGPPGVEREVANSIADLLRQQDPGINQTPGLVVEVIRGYNLGFTAKFTSTRFDYPSPSAPRLVDPPSPPDSSTDQP